MPLPVYQIVQAVFSIDEVTTFSSSSSLRPILRIQLRQKVRQTSFALACSAGACAQLVRPPSFRLQSFFLTITVRAMVKDITVAGSWNLRRRLVARADTSVLQADCDFSSVFRIREYWLQRVALTGGKRTSHRVGQSGLTWHAGAVDAMRHWQCHYQDRNRMTQFVKKWLELSRQVMITKDTKVVH